MLALVSLAALTATAFLAASRLERSATRPLGEKVRLEMALNIGFNCAKEIINNGMGSSYDNIVTYWRTNSADELGYLLLGTPRYTSGNPALYWNAAFSSGTMTELATNAPPTAVMTNRITVTNQSMFSNVISNFMTDLTKFTNGATNLELIGHTALNPRTSPPVGWVTIRQPVRVSSGSTNTVSQPVMRFAFYVEDLSGLVDAERMCGSANRDTGTNPTEISVVNLGSGISFDTTPSKRATYLSPYLLATNGGVATANLRYFATGLRSWTNAIQRIPRGVAVSATKTYGNATNADGAKLALNDPANLTVQKIATAISNNLPDFSSRAGAMAAGAYISNIAANIIDYIDIDSKPTVDNPDNPTYLGIENLPWPNELFDRITFTDVTLTGLIRIELKDYVEVWNMGNKEIPAGSTISLSNNYDLMLTMSNNGSLPTYKPVSFRTNLTNFTLESGSFGFREFSNSSSLLPNGYKVLGSTTDPSTRRLSIQITNTISSAYWTDPLVKNNWVIFSPSTDATKNMAYVARFGNTAIQKSINGRWTRYLSPSYAIRPPAGAYIFCNNLGYASQESINGVPKHTGGDPRAQLFLSGPLYNQNYTNGYASPGGRNVGRLQLSSFPESEVNPEKFWPDNGHANSSDYGGDPKTYSQSPTSFPPLTPPLTNNYVMKRNDTGKLTNITELGNIYDPMQWSDQSGSGVANQPGLWTNLTAAATGSSLYGGRTSLRIGRPEFTRFAFTNLGGSKDLPVPNMGQAAVALLDIFCATNALDDGGKININTAPAPVLSALAGGITVSSDPAKVGAEQNARMIRAFTNGVMKFRHTYPFYSPSQLSFISTNYGDANWTNNWPNTAVFSTNIGGGLNGISAMNDQGMEEWFSKIYPLTSVDSRNFRVYVYAQLVNSNNVPYGRVMRKYYHVFAEQTAESTGTPFSGAGYSMIPERESEY